MVRIGKTCTLELVKLTPQGAYLDGGPYGEILLPGRYVSEENKAGDDVEVFISFDSEDRIVATTDKPFVMAGEVGFLEVVDVTRFGAFLDWGLPKNLFVPFREQIGKMQVGKKYMVGVYVDSKTGRLVGTEKYRKLLNQTEPDFELAQLVDLIIADKTELGYNAIINKTHIGLLYENETFKPLESGMQTKGYIKSLRDDGKIDLTLEKPGYGRIGPIANIILTKLEENNGVINLSDKSDPEMVKSVFGISKKAFKQALGTLYKSKQILIEPDCIKLTAKNPIETKED